MISKRLFILLFLTLACSRPAHAFLAGDTIEFGHYFDTTIAAFGENPGFRTVAAGSADEWSYVGLYTVNPEDADFLVDFHDTGTWHSSGLTFNGLRISGIDEPIGSVTIDTNLGGWDSSRLSYTPSAIDLNWHDLSWQDDSYFNVHLSPAVTPEPATILLLLSGLACLLILNSKRAKLGKK